jgi:hypothetical protein
VNSRLPCVDEVVTRAHFFIFEFPFRVFRFSILLFLESDGCLVALAVFKTVVGSFTGRGMFDSYPLRHSRLRMRIISGGQTGVDRAALDFAISHGIDHGGWCPRGRLAEDGAIPERYLLLETESADPAERTERNVIESDGTLIITRDPELSGGTLFTRQCAEGNGKPFLVILESAEITESAAALRAFVELHCVTALNVAGPRESEAPGLAPFVVSLLSLADETSGSVV